LPSYGKVFAMPKYNEEEREEVGVAWHACRLEYRSASVLQAFIQRTKEINTPY
jgi:hypothetical protein